MLISHGMSDLLSCDFAETGYLHTTDPQSKQDRIPYKQSLPHQSCRHALSPTVILV